MSDSSASALVPFEAVVSATIGDDTLAPLDDLAPLGELEALAPLPVEEELAPLDEAPAERTVARVAKPVTGLRDWFIVPWDDVEARLGLRPGVLPGVRTMADHPASQLAPATHPIYRRQTGRSAQPPHPYRVHRSLLPVLGYCDVTPPPACTSEQRAVLRPHQLTAVEFIRARRGTLLADEQRLGKTATVTYAHDPESGVMVVLGPVNARLVWHEWAARRFGACLDVWDGKPCLTCARLGAKPEQAPSFVSLLGRSPNLALLQRGARVMFGTYAVVDAWSNQFASFGKIGTLACDEAHLAGIQNRRNSTVQGVQRLNTVAYRTIFASGTPMWNKVPGLYPIVETVCPASFGTYWEAMIRYAGAKPGPHGWVANEITNERELELRLSAIMLRRTWNEIRSDLPPIDRTIDYIELSEEAHRKVFDLANELRKQAGLGKPQTVVGNLERMRKLYAGTKIERAVEIVRGFLAHGHSVVAWTAHAEAAKDLAEAFEGDVRVFGPIHHEVPPKGREQVLDEVRSYHQPRVLVATMGTLATAVSLTWASHQVFVELDWTPARIQQAEMRPFDGTKPISSVYLVADCEPDRNQAAALLAKLEANATLGLQSGTGDVAEILGRAFGIGEGTTLDAVASMILHAETL